MKRYAVILIYLLIASLALSLPAAWAQSETTSPLVGRTWVRLGGPLGGLGYDIRMRPDNPDRMYVTDAFSGVHISADGGLTWEPANENIALRVGSSGDAIPVFCLTIDPNNPDIVWIGLQNLGGLYRSEDGGATWQPRMNGLLEREGLSFRGITIEPGNSAVIYAAGEIASWLWNGELAWGREFDRTQGVVYKSTDSGQTWRPIWRGDNLARYVWIDPTDVNTIYVSTGIFDREAANSNPQSNTPGGVGILKSTDGGETWVQINEGLDSLYVGSLFMHPTNPQILLAGVGNNAYPGGSGVYLTENGGAHWEQVAEGDRISSVEFASDPRIAYAGGEMLFLRSQDGGHTWLSITRPGSNRWGPEDIRPGFPIDLQVDPRNPMRIFVNNYGGGNFLSEDGGETWVSASTGYTGVELIGVAIHPSNPGIVYIAGRSGPFMSIDGGITWKGLNPRDGREIAATANLVVNPQNPDRLLMSDQEGVLYEGSGSPPVWRVVLNYANDLWARDVPNVNVNFQGMQAIAFAPSEPDRVYGGFGISSCVVANNPQLCTAETIFDLFVSDDGGHTWTQQKNTALKGLNISAIVVHPTNADIAWAATAGAGVYHTSNGGRTWEPSATTLGVSNLVMDLAGDPTNPEVLYAAVYGEAIYKSSDGGVTWQQSSAGLDPNDRIQTVVVDPVRPNVIYSGSLVTGFSVSEDGGATWQPLNDGLRMRAVQDMAISADGETLYAATIGEGTFRLSTLSQAEFAALAPRPMPETTPEPTETAIVEQSATQESEATQPPPATQAMETTQSPGCPVSFIPLVGVALVVLRIKRQRPSR